LFEIDKFIS